MQKGTIVRDTQNTNGMLYKGTEVTIKERACSCSKGVNNIRVEDSLGRTYWIGNNDILIE